MRLDIENRILIPFMVLIIISISVMTAVSYLNGYNLLLANETKNYTYDLKEIMIFMEKFHEDFKTESIQTREDIISYYHESGKKEMIIFDVKSNTVLLNNSGADDNYAGNVMGEIRGPDDNVFSEKDSIFVYDVYERYNWMIGFRIDKTKLHYDVLENEKTLILVAIVAMIFSMQAAILISYNISRPVKKLAEYCDNVADSDGAYEKMELKRDDEIGILSKAFNNMLDRLKRNTEKIMEMTRFNEDILKNIPAGIITTDKDGHLLSVNEAAKNLLHENRRKNRDIDIMETLLEQLSETLKSNRVINNILTFNDIEGNTIYLDVTTSLLKGNESSKDGAICSFNDISDRKKFEKNMDLLDRLTSIGQFAAGIAHEIRNPLTGMKTSIQVLENRMYKNYDSSNERLFSGVIQEIDRINNLISGLLNFAKPRASKFEKTNLEEVLENTLTLLAKHADENDVEIKVSGCENAEVCADKAQMEQIFLNIIKNSISAVERSGLVTVCFSNSLREDGMYVTAAFYDNGCGIQLKDMPKIFNPFFTTKSQGTGLGLSVVYELVKINHGKIDIQSVEGEGTKVRIDFPAYGGKDFE